MDALAQMMRLARSQREETKSAPVRGNLYLPQTKIPSSFLHVSTKTGEKMGSTQKTETSEEFKRLETETELRMEYTTKIHDGLELYLKTMGKPHKDLDGKEKKLPVDILGSAMIGFGSMLHDGSNYGKALMKIGEAQEQIADYQNDYVTKLRDSYVTNLNRVMSDIKEYKAIQKKLESRRLDFDAKLNKAHKAKKEKPEFMEETRIAQSKYEESLTDMTQKMIDLNSNEDDQLENLIVFFDAQVAYYQSCAE
ncbi:hypothetical protein HK104_000539, partial [Borealophlyctis nickersoniae]